MFLILTIRTFMETQLQNQFTYLLFRTDCFKINKIIVFIAVEESSSVRKLLLLLIKKLDCQRYRTFIKKKVLSFGSLCIRGPAVSSKKICRKTFSSIIHTDIFIIKLSLDLEPKEVKQRHSTLFKDFENYCISLIQLLTKYIHS